VSGERLKDVLAAHLVSFRKPATLSRRPL